MKKPNVIFILADDMSYADIGCYGQTIIKTPHIDRLAAEGMRFTQCYAGASICGPSRCSLMTGKHMGHARIRDNSARLESGTYCESLKQEDLTVAEVMKQAGYTTGLVGKWGIGEPGTEGVPNRKGFDYAVGFWNQIRAHSYYPEYVWKNDQAVLLEGNIGFDMNRLYLHNKAHYLNDQYPNEYDEEGNYIPSGVKDPSLAVNTHDLCTSEALGFIQRHAEEPFFLYLAYQNPHGPLVVPSLAPYTDADFPSQKHKEWAALITRMDTDIGQIMNLLQELGLDENTIVMFGSDNGYSAWGYFGLNQDESVPFFDHRGPFRGGKFSLYEGGLRVPFVARWPGQIPSGTVSEHVWAFWDVLPTFAELAGVEPAGECDGISFLQALLGKSAPEHDFLYWELGHAQALRLGNWKAYREHPSQPTQLYDLSKDEGELIDLSADYPDVVCQAEGIMKSARTDSPIFTNPGETSQQEVSKRTGLVPNGWSYDSPEHLKWLDDLDRL